VIPLSLLCVDRTDCKGLVFGFSGGTNEAVEHAARMLAIECRRDGSSGTMEL
jgi:hypothetical protein